MWRLRQLVKRLARAARDLQTRIRHDAVKRKWAALKSKVLGDADATTLLHIGCGEINAAGFINIDARRQPHVHIVTTNLFKLEMIPSNTVDLIYMSHVLEHVGHRDVVTTLREMHRILKSGGILRISVPDFDKILDIYQASDNDITAIIQPLMGGQDYPFNYHYTVFNEAHLRSTMTRGGFRTTRHWDPELSSHHDFEDWASKKIPRQGRDFPISLNIEAVK